MAGFHGGIPTTYKFITSTFLPQTLEKNIVQEEDLYYLFLMVNGVTNPPPNHQPDNMVWFLHYLLKFREVG